MIPRSRLFFVVAIEVLAGLGMERMERIG